MSSSCRKPFVATAPLKEIGAHLGEDERDVPEKPYLDGSICQDQERDTPPGLGCRATRRKRFLPISKAPEQHVPEEPRSDRHHDQVEGHKQDGRDAEPTLPHPSEPTNYVKGIVPGVVDADEGWGIGGLPDVGAALDAIGGHRGAVVPRRAGPARA